MHPGELVTAIRFPVVAPPTRVSFEKVSKRRFLDIASVNTAARLTVEDGVVTGARISVGGVAPVPLFAAETSRGLVGRTLDATTVKDALDLLDGELSPISDVRGSAAYKRLLARNLVAAHFLEGWPDRVSPRDVLGEGFAA
jgi:xanthine dehydrogenase small subunit